MVNALVVSYELVHLGSPFLLIELEQETNSSDRMTRVIKVCFILGKGFCVTVYLPTFKRETGTLMYEAT